MHEADLQVVKEKSKVEVQKSSENAKAKDIDVEDANMMCDKLIDEPVMITTKCLIVAPVRDYQVDKNQELDKEEIQHILTNTLAPESVMLPNTVDLVFNMPEVDNHVKTCASLQPLTVRLPYHEPKHMTSDMYYEIFLILDAHKRTGLHHNMIVGGFGLWLCGLSSPRLLIISLYKTEGRVFLIRGI